MTGKIRAERRLSGEYATADDIEKSGWQDASVESFTEDEREFKEDDGTKRKSSFFRWAMRLSSVDKLATFTTGAYFTENAKGKTNLLALAQALGEWKGWDIEYDLNAWKGTHCDVFVTPTSEGYVNITDLRASTSHAPVGSARSPAQAKLACSLCGTPVATPDELKEHMVSCPEFLRREQERIAKARASTQAAPAPPARPVNAPGESDTATCAYAKCGKPVRKAEAVIDGLSHYHVECYPKAVAEGA